jgi:hypothetical protein
MFSSHHIARRVAVLLLVGGAVVSVGALLFSISMEGMRHSRPGPGQFDSYYWVAGLPVALSIAWLTNSLITTRRSHFVSMLVATTIVAALWLSILWQEDPWSLGCSIGFVGFSSVACIVAWSMQDRKGSESKAAQPGATDKPAIGDSGDDLGG